MKCFSIDLDGTFLNSDGKIPEENLAALKYLQDKGHKVLINTGRAIEDVISMVPLKQTKVPIISINGTVLYSENRNLIYETSIPVSTYKQLLSLLKPFDLRIMIYTNQGGFPCRNPELKGKSEDEIEAIFNQYDYDQLLKKEDIKIYKVMAVARPGEFHKIEEVKDACKSIPDINQASSHENNIEFTSAEADKGNAILRYQQLIGVRFDEIFAFGDGGNDLSQFRVATTSVAMENAPSYVRERADLITKSNDENGFSYAIHELLKI